MEAANTHTLLREFLLPADISSLNFSILAVKTHDPVERETIGSEFSLLACLPFLFCFVLFQEFA